jgi:predicted phosphodiesterase
MRIAVLSDVHGNRLALEAVLDDIVRQAPDATVNLGDMVSGPLEPRAVANLLMDAGFPAVRGNHERWLHERPRDMLDAVDGFARSELEPRHLEWFASLPATLTLAGEIFLCHGTPQSDSEPWLDNWWVGRDTTLPDEAAVTARAEGHDFPVLLCGHTHLPRAVRLRDGRLIVNPGAVGLQINHGSPDARYAIIERIGGRWSASLRAVPYDQDAAARQAVAHGFPAWSEVLATGWVGARGLFSPPEADAVAGDAGTHRA